MSSMVKSVFDWPVVTDERTRTSMLYVKSRFDFCPAEFEIKFGES